MTSIIRILGTAVLVLSALTATTLAHELDRDDAFYDALRDRIYEEDWSDDLCGRVEAFHLYIRGLHEKIHLIQHLVEHKEEALAEADNTQVRRSLERQLDRLAADLADWQALLLLTQRDAGAAAVAQEGIACDVPNLYYVGADLEPFADALPGSYSPDPRPLAVLRDPHGRTGHFVANELVVPQGQAADIASRWNGSVMATIDPTGTGSPVLALLVVDTSGVEIDAFPGLEAQLTDTRGAVIEVSSDQGLAMLTIAAAEAAAGHEVAINWVGRAQDYLDGIITEDLSGPGGWTDLPGQSWSRNPYDWNHMRGGSDVGLGIVEAWTALDEAGKLDNKIGIAILDGGFYPDINGDFPAGFRAISVVGATAALNTQGLDPGATDHGTPVLNTAAAAADNGRGVIGTGSPVADTIAIFTGYDLFHTTSALDQARMAGARVANMSYGGWVPAGLEWSMLPFEIVFQAIHDAGLVLVAAAGNDADNNDNRVCIGDLCWETGFNYPCELTKTYCIGGIQTLPCSDPDPDVNRWCGGAESLTPRQRAPNSNRGQVPNNDTERGVPNDPTVDIWAPYRVVTGPRPANTSGVHVIQGTSFAAPYVAGLAALVLAADPSLGPSEVMQTIHFTGDIPFDDEGNRDPEVKLIANPLAAVSSVLDQVCPCVSIQRPLDGATFNEGDAISPLGTVYGGTPDDVSWIIRSGSSTGPVVAARGGLSPTPVRVVGGGPHVYQLVVIFEDGSIRTDEVTVNYVNSPPTVEILSPLADAVLTDNEMVRLRARTTDVGYPGGLPDGNVDWFLDDSGIAIATGHDVMVSFAGESLGAHTLRAEATDGFETASDFIGFTLIEGGDNTPPTIVISNPSDEDVIVGSPNGMGGWEAFVDFQAVATDPDPADILTVNWYLSQDGGPSQFVGSGAQILSVPLEISSCFGSVFTITATVSDGTNPERSDTVAITVVGSEIC